jgi:hypothetical protein
MVSRHMPELISAHQVNTKVIHTWVCHHWMNEQQQLQRR